MPSMDTIRVTPSADVPSVPTRRRLGPFSPRTNLMSVVKRGSADSAIAGLDVPAPIALPIREVGYLRSHSCEDNPFAGSPPSAPVPPSDLRDAKRLEPMERSRLSSPTEGSQERSYLAAGVPKPMRRKPPPIVPELSHLRARGHSPDRSSAASTSSASSSASIRRQAKTAIFRLGRQEGKGKGKPSFGRDPRTAAKTSSVELIAGQYSAFLERRDALELEEEEEEEEEECGEENEALDLHDHAVSSVHSTVHSLRSEAPRARPRHVVLESVQAGKVGGRTSSESSRGHSNSNSEDAIYFRPVSWSAAEEGPPPRGDEQTGSRDGSSIPPQAPDSLSLRICLDLLRRELTPSGAGEGQSDRGGGGGSALQTWVMIEAYERLRDRVAEMELAAGDRRNMDMMLRGWLDTLYAVHHQLSSRRPSEGGM